MGRPLRIEFPGAFYHVAARGNERGAIFKSQTDRERFLGYLESASERYGAVIHCYCLMTNHYHLLIETPEANLSQIMRHINGAYTNYFNTKRKRAGHLFQGRYHATLVDREAYALELSRYIHLNPVRAGMTKGPEDHPWSSYRAYLQPPLAPIWLKRDVVLAPFGGDGGKYRTFVEETLGTEVSSPLAAARGTPLLGPPEFVGRMAATHLEGREPCRDLPELRRIERNWPLVAILQAVPVAVPEDPRLARRIAIHLCHRYSGAKLKEIGEKFGLGESAISQESRRLVLLMEKDEALRRRVEGIKDRWKSVKV